MFILKLSVAVFALLFSTSLAADPKLIGLDLEKEHTSTYHQYFHKL